MGESLQLSDGAAIWLLVILLGLAGILYAVIGGLRAMAVADSINGIGLVIGGLMVPLFGLIAMGKGSFMQGIEQLTTVHAEKLNSVGGPTDPLPIGAAFTGLILVNTFYWCTNQGIVQRTLASKAWRKGKRGAVNGGAENARPAGTGAARVDCVSSVSGFTESRHGLPDAGQ